MSTTLEDLVARICDLYRITIEHLRSGSRRAGLVEARSLFCYWAVRQNRFPAATIASFLNMTPPGVGYAVDRGGAIARETDYRI